MEKLTHWGAKFDHNWIGAYILPNGEPIVVEILKVEWKEKQIIMGKENDGWVATFAPNDFFKSPMLLNKTNCKRLEKLTHTPFPEKWKNIKVTLLQEMDKAIGGGKAMALRISDRPPINKQLDLTEPTKKMNECKNLTELQTVYLSLTKDEQAVLVNLKNELKIKLA